MNSYIILDGKRYPAKHKDFLPVKNRPIMERALLDGTRDVVYGSSFLQGWEGTIVVPTSESDPYGDIADLRTTMDKKTTVSMTDHYGNVHTVALLGDLAEDSISPMWDANTNKYNIKIRIAKVS